MAGVFANTAGSVQPDAVPAVKKKRRMRVPKFTIPPARKKDLFFTLPGELRNTIYKLVLRVDSGKDRTARIRFDSRWKEPALLRVAKTYRREAMPIYYKSNDFMLRLDMALMDQAADWLRTVQRMCGTAPFNSFSFIINNEVWPKLERLKPLVFMIAETGLTLTPNQLTAERKPKATCPSERRFTRAESATTITPSEPCVLWPYKAYDRPTCKVLKESLELGQRARVEQWNSLKPCHEFYKWLNKKMNSSGCTLNQRAPVDMRIRTRIDAKLEMLEHLLELARREKSFRLGWDGSSGGGGHSEPVLPRSDEG